MDYKSQRKWSDSYIPAVTKILFETLPLNDQYTIVVSSDEIDMKEAADLCIIAPDGRDMGRIALRLRLATQYMSKYPYDFTIRYQYTAGYKTEFAKIEEGSADLMFYGFVENGKIVRWLLLNLDELRAEINEPYIIYEQNNNKDGRNQFRGYDIRSFKNENLIVGTSAGFFDLIELMFPRSDGNGVIRSRIFKQAT